MEDLPIGAKMQNYPIHEMLISLARGIVKAQSELDQASIEATRIASTATVNVPIVPEPTDPAAPKERSQTLLQLGLVPSFLSIDTVQISLDIEISMHMEEESALAVSVGVEASKDGSSDGGESSDGGSKSSSSSVSFGASIDVSTSRKYGVDMSANTRLDAIIKKTETPPALLRFFTNS